MNFLAFWTVFLAVLASYTLAVPRTHSWSRIERQLAQRSHQDGGRRTQRSHPHDGFIGRSHQEDQFGSRRSRKYEQRGFASSALAPIITLVDTTVQVAGVVVEVGTVVRDSLREIGTSIDDGISQIGTHLFGGARKRSKVSSQQSLTENSEMIGIAAVIEEDAVRLKYFEQFMDNDANFDVNSQIIVSEGSLAWTEAVLSEDSDGIRAVLDDIHGMIAGTNLQEPVLEVYIAHLRLSGFKNVVVQETEKFIETLNNMQNLGYALYVIALDVAGRSDEVTSFKHLMEQRMAAQQEYLLLEELFLSWPQG